MCSDPVGVTECCTLCGTARAPHDVSARANVNRQTVDRCHAATPSSHPPVSSANSASSARFVIYARALGSERGSVMRRGALRHSLAHRLPAFHFAAPSVARVLHFWRFSSVCSDQTCAAHSGDKHGQSFYASGVIPERPLCLLPSTPAVAGPLCREQTRARTCRLP